ncbi:MAG TPA: NIPSNAP family protein [Bryobacteraceae bacterium]|nr:NIPSNAP family protein [Bryobacteraceae bacterium]
MQRRQFIGAAASSGLAAVPLAAAEHNAFIELRYYYMRNGRQTQRTADFLNKYFLPAAARLKIGPLGFFGAVIAQHSPFVLALISYPSAAAFADSMERLAADKEFQRGFDEYNSMTELSYIRMENSLLRAFDCMPSVALPPAGQNSPRIFELRTYESNNVRAAQRKVRMFNEGEAAIFKRLGMAPVFFGETLAGRNLPNLTYMLSFESMASRDKLWGAFGADPEWQKLRAQPGYADADIVSNISNAILRPLDFSPIR